MTKAQAKAVRLKGVEKQDEALLLKQLQEKLLLDMKVSLEVFTLDEKSILPGYCLKMNGKDIGFADVLYGRREDFLKVKVSTYRNGVFFTEHFGIPKDETLKECVRFRYVVFLLAFDAMYKWVYKPEKVKAHPVLNTEDGMYVYIDKKELEVLK